MVQPHERNGHAPKRRNVTSDQIRIRLQKQGWSLKELPIRRNHPDANQRKVLSYKVIAFRGVQSIEAGGSSQEEAVANIGRMLGVIPKA